MLINSSENLGFEKRNEVFATFIEHHYEVLLNNVRHCTKKVVSAAQFVSLGSDLWLTLVYHTFYCGTVICHDLPLLAVVYLAKWTANKCAIIASSISILTCSWKAVM